MRVKWARLALVDLIAAQDHIATENPDAARRIAARIHEATRRLGDYPLIGRVGDDPDTREWPVRRTPYLVVYEIRDDAIEILRVWHMRRDRTRTDEG